MARLTWQNVDSPNFSGVADSYRTFSELLGNATKSGSAMIDTFTKANSDAADKAILQRALALQDPVAYNAALAAGTLVGAEGKNASIDTLKGLDSRVSKLLGNAVVGEGLQRETFDNDRYIQGKAIEDSNADQINKARSLAASGRGNEAIALLGSIPGLRTEQFASILGDQEKSMGAALGRDVTGQALTERRWGFGNEVADDASTRAARGRVAEIISQYANADDARPALLEAVGRGEISADVLMKTLQGAAGMGYGNILAPSGTGTGGGGGKSVPIGSSGFSYDAPQQAVGAALRNTGLPDAVVAGFLGNFHHEGGYSGAKGDGGSAAGIAQWRGDRQKNFKEVIGKDVTQATPEEQARFVKWELDNPSKAGMTTDQRDAILAAKTPEEAASLIDQYYERSDGKARAGRAAAAADAYSALSAETPVEAGAVTGMITQALTEGTSQRNAVGITPNYDRLLGDNRTVNDVVSGLVGEGGVYPGSDRGELTKAVNYLIKKSGNRINAAIAGEMLARSTQENDAWYESLGNAVKDLAGAPFGRPIRSANQKGGVRIDDDAVYAALDDYTSGRTSRRDQLNEFAAARAQEVEAANLAYQSALGQYKAAVLGSATDPRMARMLPRIKAQLDQAQAIRDQVRGQASADPSLKPKFDVTAPPETDNTGWQSGPNGNWRIKDRLDLPALPYGNGVR